MKKFDWENRPLKSFSAGKCKQKLTIYFDTETCKNTRDLEDENLVIWPYLVGFSFGKESYYTDGEQFIRYLMDLHTKFQLILVGHNVLYDIKALLAIIDKTPSLKGYYVEVQTQKKNDWFLFGFISHTYLHITFRDTLLWDKSRSIQKWCELIGKGFKKGSIEYDKKNAKIDWENNKITWLGLNDEICSCDLQYEVDYLKVDVEILHQIVLWIKNFKNNAIFCLGKIFKYDKDYVLSKAKCLTIGGFAKTLLDCTLEGCEKYSEFYKKGYFDHLYRAETEKVEYSWEQYSSSIGGFTAYNPSTLECVDDLERIKSFDVTSMYPWVMEEGLCYEEPYLCEPPEGEYVKWYRLQYQKISWNPEYKDFLSQDPWPHSRAQLFGKNRKVNNIWICEEYYKLLLKVSDIGKLKISNIFYQKKGKHMKNYMNKLFELKKNGKKDEVSTAKLLLNAVYGKTIESVHDTTYIYDGKTHIVENKNLKTIKNRFYSSGVYIVQKSRCKLISAIIEQIDIGNTFLYCDTDSIKFLEIVKDENTAIYKEGGDELGLWKFEGKFTHYRNNKKAKKYCLINKIENHSLFRLSGIDGNIQNFIVEKADSDLIWDLFDTKNNYCFINGKTKGNLVGKFSQSCISSINVEINPGIDITHYVSLKNDELFVEKI